MQHWYTGDNSALPNIFERFRRSQAYSLTAKMGDTVVRITPGAGNYEDKFRYYWYMVAWSLLIFQALNMLIVTAHACGLLAQYNWAAHLLGTSIIFISMGFAAVIYRFVLFPIPSYYSHGEEAAAVATQLAKAAPASKPNGAGNGAVDSGELDTTDVQHRAAHAAASMRN